MSNKTRVEIDFTQLEQQRIYGEKLSQLLQNDYIHRPLAFVHSYGCQANVADGERIKGILQGAGYAFTDSAENADLVLFNTCAVRESAQDRVYGNVGALKQHKRNNPGMVIALCGCMMQQQKVADRIKNSFPYVDIVFGTNAIHLLPRMLYERLSGGGRVFELEGGGTAVVENLPLRRDGKYKAWLPIMYGCDNFCSYCIVPHVRGRERSRSPRHILEEARQLIAEGYRDITLLGQNVNSYGKGLEEEIDFAGLLERLCELEGDFRIRFMTSHPKDCSRRLIDTIARNPKVCRHIHLPVQCGSDRILKQMNRGYTAEKYLELAAYAKEKIPGLLLTSDIIVGFPGETEADFEETLALIQKVEYASLFTFIYSQREGTPAAAMPDGVPHSEKARWMGRLLAAQEAISSRIHQAMVGQTVRVLAEEPAKNTPGMLTGRSDEHLVVDFAADEALLGSFVQVKITEANLRALTGEVVN